MKFDIFEKFPNLRYGISDKKDGFMDIKTMGDLGQDKIAQLNRNKFYKSCGFEEKKVLAPYLVHGNKAVVVSEENIHKNNLADGFVTNVSGIILTITVGDCFPLYFFDPVKNAIGLAHGGWRGVVSGIARSTINKFAEVFDSKLEDILLGIGPGIQKCHFFVKDDVIDSFKDYEEFIKDNGESYFIDLEGIIKKQAQETGLVSIESSGECTYCLADKYFSYRRDKPKIPEVMLAYIKKEN